MNFINLLFSIFLFIFLSFIWIIIISIGSGFDFPDGDKYGIIEKTIFYVIFGGGIIGILVLSVRIYFTGI